MPRSGSLASIPGRAVPGRRRPVVFDPHGTESADDDRSTTMGQEGARRGAPRCWRRSRPGGTATTTSSPTASPRSSPAGSTEAPGRSPGRCVGSSATTRSRPSSPSPTPPRHELPQQEQALAKELGGEVGPRPDRRPPRAQRQGGDLRPARGSPPPSSPTPRISRSTSIATTGSTGRRWSRWPTG